MCIRLQLARKLVLPLKLVEKSRLAVLGSHTANVDVPVLLEITATVEMYDEKPRGPSHSNVPSVANDSSVILVGDRRLSDWYLEIGQIVLNLHQLFASARESNNFRMV